MTILLGAVVGAIVGGLTARLLVGGTSWWGTPMRADLFLDEFGIEGDGPCPVCLAEREHESRVGSS